MRIRPVVVGSILSFTWALAVGQEPPASVGPGATFALPEPNGATAQAEEEPALVGPPEPGGDSEDRTIAIEADTSFELTVEEDAHAASSAAVSEAWITNDDVVEMVAADFGESTIIAALRANPTRFDVTPRALLGLKRAAVPESVIEAMLGIETENRQAALQQAAASQPASDANAGAGTGTASNEASTDATSGDTDSTLPASAEPAAAALAAPDAHPAADAPISAEAQALLLTQLMEQLARQSSAAPEPEPAEAAGAATAKAWLGASDRSTALTATVAQVALTDLKGNAGTALKTLQGLASNALAFANPAIGLATAGLGIFRPGDPTKTVVWALRGPNASRVFEPGAVLEVDYAGIPGVNPDEFEPAIVQLIPTGDNFRLVGATRARVSELGGVPSNPIVEERIAAQRTSLGRGRQRIKLPYDILAGEYALVLRPKERTRRQRRDAENSLAELLREGGDDILALTWDFSIRR